MADNPIKVLFTKEMKKDYKILIPTMLPRHFKIISGVLNSYGYNTEILEDSGKRITELGLRYVHNDACYPSIIVIGQFLAALESGRYDTHKVALIYMQTGGGCRASNYISLLRKALARAGYGYVPVISINFSGLESHPGFKLTVPLVRRAMYAITYGDLLMSLVNQTKPYEIIPGTSERLADEWTETLAAQAAASHFSYKKVKNTYKKIIRSFDEIPRRKRDKIKVGVVGEIFVKFSPLGNNNLEQFLLSEGAEVVMPGLLDFLMYCVYNGIIDNKLYGRNKLTLPAFKIADKYLLTKQRDMIAVYEDTPFEPPTPFEHTRTLTEGYMGIGAKMGEGWLLTAEMLELIENGAENIVCTQPFGCLPNHIVGKGVMKLIRERHPESNIVAIDYDAGATQINQENRIKLMLANAQRKDTAEPQTAAPEPQKTEKRKQAVAV